MSTQGEVTIVLLDANGTPSGLVARTPERSDSEERKVQVLLAGAFRWAGWSGEMRAYWMREPEENATKWMPYIGRTTAGRLAFAQRDVYGAVVDQAGRAVPEESLPPETRLRLAEVRAEMRAERAALRALDRERSRQRKLAESEK